MPWIQPKVNKAKSKVKLEVGLSIQACPLLGYAIQLCELYLGHGFSNRWSNSNLGCSWVDLTAISPTTPISYYNPQCKQPNAHTRLH